MNLRNYWQAAAIACVVAVALAPAPGRAQTRQELTAARNHMVDEEIVAAGVTNPRVVQAMRNTPRHEFIPLAQRKPWQIAYYDMALPIGEAQTISPPFIVAYMTQSIDPQPGDKVLEIGTGSGYQAAVLSPLVREVYTIEIVASLGHRAEKTLQRLHYDNVHVKIGDGYLGWTEHAPFDKIIVTCSPEQVPQALVDQVKEGGQMVIPVGQRYQQTLYLLKKVKGKMVSETLLPVLFVPMTGAAEGLRRVQPDPLRPALENGDFEKVKGDPRQPVGWYYQRQLTVVSDGESPSGKKNYVAFRNSEPGRGCQALQGFAVDGRKIHKLNVSLMIRGRKISAGQAPDQVAALVITFYAENRATLTQTGIMGPWVGSFDWQSEGKLIEVPIRAREAILRIGLMGGVGELDVDKVELKAAKNKGEGGGGKAEGRGHR